MVSLLGSRDMDAKELVAFELGYRIQPHQRVTFDLATFYNIYDKERSLEAQAPDLSNFPGYIVQPYVINNMIDGETYGFELASTWQATDWWRIRVQLHLLEVESPQGVWQHRSAQRAGGGR
jgi:iron complex outermembrane receptor protein